ncbi:sigma-70 family RNA polymerase sigma factor [Candidatus Vidania fulgoroideorum]
MRIETILTPKEEFNLFKNLENSSIYILKLSKYIPIFCNLLIKFLKKDFCKRFRKKKKNNIKIKETNETSSVLDFEEKQKEIYKKTLIKMIYLSKNVGFKNKVPRFFIWKESLKIIRKFKSFDYFIRNISVSYRKLFQNYIKTEKRFLSSHFFNLSKKNINFILKKILMVSFLKSATYINKSLCEKFSKNYKKKIFRYKKLIIQKNRLFISSEKFKKFSINFFELISSYKNSRRIIVEFNQRLIISIAKVYKNKGLAFGDLIQEGNIGLIKSISRFNYKKGYKFSTYSTWWIRQAITRSLSDSSRIIRIPVHMTEVLSKIGKIKRTKLEDNQKIFNSNYIQKKLGIKKSKLNKLINISKIPASLEGNVSNFDSKTSYVELIGNTKQQYDDFLINIEFNNTLKILLELLGEKEGLIIGMRFGLFNNKSMTLEEVGNIFGVTRERIRQIENNSLDKIRNSSIMYILRNIMKGR